MTHQFSSKISDRADSGAAQMYWWIRYMSRRSASTPTRRFGTLPIVHFLIFSFFGAKYPRRACVFIPFLSTFTFREW